MTASPHPDPALLPELQDRLEAALGLARPAVAATFHATPAEHEASPLPGLKRAMSYCSLLRLALLGHARKADLSGMRCPGARRALGLIPPDAEFTSGRRYLSLGLYADQERARQTAARVATMPGPMHGVAVQPLRTCTALPHVVILVCSPYQAMRLAQGWVWGHGPLEAMTSLGAQGVCAELTVLPHLAGRPNVSLLCSNTRYDCAWEDGEVGVGIPSAAFAETVRGVLATLDAAEPDRRKRDIALRSRENGSGLAPRPGAAYFLKPSAPASDSGGRP